MSWALLITGAYLLGSLSFSVLLVKAVTGHDVRTLGSGNAGATNALRTAGRAAGLATLILDVAKGVAPVALARAIGAPGRVIAGAALAAVLGHLFPVFHRFRGGKGVATGAGAQLALAPMATAMAVGLFVVTVAATHYVALGSIVAAVSMPLLIWLCGALGWSPPPPPWLLLTSAVISLLVTAKHHTNLRRLAAGQEDRIEDRIDLDERAEDR